MAKQMKTKVKAKKGAKKSFYEISAPLVSQKIHLYAPSEESLHGRTVKIDLTKNLRGKSLEVRLRVKYEDGVLGAEADNVTLANSYIRRVIRKGTDYCEDSFETDCRDMKVRIKPFMITRKRVSRAVLNALRVESKDFLQTYLKTRNAQEIISDIMTNKLQKQLALKLKKIYPLALCEIRVFDIVGPLDPKKVSKEDAKEESKSDDSQK